jgi:hypothetical protein
MTHRRPQSQIAEPPSSPLSILNAARKAVPAVDYALGAAGIAAAGAIVVGLLGNGRAAVIISGAMFISMVLLFIFSRLITTQSVGIVIAGMVLLWAVTIFFCTFLLFTATAFAFQWPPPWAQFLGLTPSSLSYDPQHYRLLKVVSGGPDSPCAAEDSGSKVQLFAHGWFLARFSHQLFYAIIRSAEYDAITWLSHTDDYTGSPSTCVNVVNQDLLTLGFRHWYCSPSSEPLRRKLGEPITREMGAWVQYQQWSNGLLAHGLPGNNILRNGSFTELVGMFFSNEDMNDEYKPGRIVQFTFHNAAPHDAYCAALWYPADIRKPVPDDLRKNCSGREISGVTYLRGRDRCLVSGFD